MRSTVWKDTAKEKGCDLVIGIGGGKIFDTAKAAAYYEDTPVIICPTIASTDAPCSALSVIYTDEGVFEEYLFLPRNPDMVLMDTEVITKSPVRLTVAGMGDALATYFEARACAASDAQTCVNGKSTSAAMALAKLCFDTLMEEGVKAKIALEVPAQRQWKKSLRPIRCCPVLVLRAADLQVHMPFTMDLRYWRNATPCITERRWLLEPSLSLFWKIYLQRSWRRSLISVSK